MQVQPDGKYSIKLFDPQVKQWKASWRHWMIGCCPSPTRLLGEDLDSTMQPAASRCLTPSQEPQIASPQIEAD